MTSIAPSSVIPMIPKRITIAILRVAVLGPISVVGWKLGTVVRWNEWLVESLSVSTRRRPLRRGEVLVVSVPTSIGLLWVGPKRVLVLRTDDVGRAGWVQELLVVAEDDVEEQSGETELNEEGENIRPSAPIPRSITPCAEKGLA